MCNMINLKIKIDEPIENPVDHIGTGECLGVGEFHLFQDMETKDLYFELDNRVVTIEMSELIQSCIEKINKS